MMAQYLNTIGLVFDIVGAAFIAYEVINPFSGQRHEVTGQLDPMFSPPPEETDDFRRWQRRRRRNGRFGLGLLSLGFTLQITATWCEQLSSLLGMNCFLDC